MASEKNSEILRALTVTDDMRDRAMDEFVKWTDQRDGMEQALREAIRPARDLLNEVRSS